MPQSPPSQTHTSDIVLNRITELEKLVLRLIQEQEKKSQAAERTEVIIMKGQNNRAENVIEEWLSELTGDVIAELDFIDKTTFGYLDSIPKMCGVRIITSNPKEFDKCINKVEKSARDRPHLEIIVINKIHQRWIGSKDLFFIEIGADLKTDSLGHSTHAMRKLEPQLFKKAIASFEELWTKSEKELRKTYGDSILKQKIYPR